MVRRKTTKTITNWEDLVKYIKSINPYNNTIILSGWVNELDEETGKTDINTIIFTICPVEILKDVNNGKYTKK